MSPRGDVCVLRVQVDAQRRLVFMDKMVFSASRRQGFLGDYICCGQEDSIRNTLNQQDTLPHTFIHVDIIYVYLRVCVCVCKRNTVLKCISMDVAWLTSVAK